MWLNGKPAETCGFFLCLDGHTALPELSAQLTRGSEAHRASVVATSESDELGSRVFSAVGPWKALRPCDLGQPAGELATGPSPLKDIGPFADSRALRGKCAGRASPMVAVGRFARHMFNLYSPIWIATEGNWTTIFGPRWLHNEHPYLHKQPKLSQRECVIGLLLYSGKLRCLFLSGQGCTRWGFATAPLAV